MSTFNTLVDASLAIQDGDVSPSELLQDTLEAVERWEPGIQALLDSDVERAIDEAKGLDRELHANRWRGPMHGIPIVVKDLIDVRGYRTTAGSRILEDNVASANARVVQRLVDGGAVVAAKSNTHEFGYGALTPPTRNPWDTERMSGGSSGGSAAAVGARVVLGSIGTDNAGSIREPAALCGVSGFKPTNGLLPSAGVYQLTWTMGTLGPIAVSVADCSLMFDVMRGAESQPAQRPLDTDLEHLAGLRFAVPREFLQPSMPYVADMLQVISERLTDLGADVEEVSIGDLDEMVSVGFLTMGSEALAIHQNWLRERGAEYTEPVRHYLELAEAYTAVDYLNAQRLRLQTVHRVDEVLRRADVLLTPAQLVTAPKIIDQTVSFPDGATLPRDLSLVRPLIPFSLTGHPALTVPVEMHEGLPLAVQLVGKLRGDAQLLKIGAGVQALSDWDFPAPSSDG